MRSRRALAALVLAALAITGWLLWRAGAGPELGLPGWPGEAAFAIALSGPLWDDRTLRGEDRAPDAAFVTADKALTVRARGRGQARVAAISVRVDGRPAGRVHARCSPLCPAVFAATLSPSLRAAGLRPGPRRVEVTVAGERPQDSAKVVLEVFVADRVPPAFEAEPGTVGSPPPAGALPRDRRARALAVVDRARRAGVLAHLLGASTPRLLQAGALRAGSRVVGVTLLYRVEPVVRDVTATLPAYAPDPAAPGRYADQQVTMTAARLADLLVDVDLRRRRIIAISPGPASRTTRWRETGPPTPAGGEDED